MHVAQRTAARACACARLTRSFHSKRSVHAEQRDVEWERANEWHGKPPQRVHTATLEQMLQQWEDRDWADTQHDAPRPKAAPAPPTWTPPRPPPAGAPATPQSSPTRGESMSGPLDSLDSLDPLDPLSPLGPPPETEAVYNAFHLPDHISSLFPPSVPSEAAEQRTSLGLRTIHDLYDWRTIAASQQGRALPGHTYTHLIGERWDANEWVWTRRIPSRTVLLRTAHQAARAASRKRNAAQESDRTLTLAARRYQQHWRRVLALERAHNEAELNEQRAQPIAELEELGIAIDGLMAFWQSERHLGRRVAVFKLPGNRRLPRHKFQPGSAVDVTPDAPPTWFKPKDGAHPAPVHACGTTCMPGEVVDVAPSQVRVRFSDAFDHVDLAAFEHWRMDRSESNVVNERINAALDAMLYEPNDVVKAITQQHRFALAGTDIRDVLTGHARHQPGLFWHDARIRSWYERYSRAHPIQLDGDPDLGLNASQMRAVAMMLKERVSLVQGPPGTGKTRTLVQTVRLLKHHFQVPHPILLAAHTNVAVDNLAEGCVNAGLRVVRAGSSTAVRASLEAHTFEAQFQRHALYPAYASAERALRDAQQQRNALQDALQAQKGSVEIRTRLQAAKRRVVHCSAKCHMLRHRLFADILHTADVVCTTAIAAGSHQLQDMDFPIVFLDESSMATEPIALIPLMKGCAQLALVGDHKQLPPVLHSVEARQAGLSTSLFERLIRGRAIAGGTVQVPSTMLDEQFRMHPTLSHFPNTHFYAGALRDAPSTAALRPFDTVFGAQKNGQVAPMTLVTHPPVAPSTSLARLSILSLGVSPHNQLQADLVLEIACDLLERNPSLTGADIGVVSPYEAQVQLLQKMLAAGGPIAAGAEPLSTVLPVLSDEALDILSAMDARRAHELGRIEVHTVDGFEGREKPVMIFSTVKASGGSVTGSAALHHAMTRPSEETAAQLEHVADTHGGYVGFLADARRMNVALTRAQRQLLIVGNLETLLCARVGEGTEHVECQDAHVIRRFARWLLAQGYVVDIHDVRDRQLDSM